MATTTLGIPIVIDNGSETIKAGFAGDTKPRDIVPSKVGALSSSSIFEDPAQRDMLNR